MSAPAAAPVLTLVPPDDPAPPAGHAQPPAIGRPALQRKMRRVTSVLCVTGGFAPVVFIAAGPYLGDVVYAGLVVSWALLVPGCGFVLLLIAALGRTRDDLRAVLAGLLSLAMGLALTQPVGRAAMEAWATSHATELDALAAGQVRLVASGGWLDANGNLSPAALTTVNGLRRLGLASGDTVDGGLLFRTNAPFAPDLLYADPSVRVANECMRLRVTPVSGRWYLYECVGSSEYEDW